MIEVKGEDGTLNMPQEVWDIFDQWYGDKSYRHAHVAEDIYLASAKYLADKIRNSPCREFDNDAFNHAGDAYYSGQDDAADYIDPNKVGILDEMEQGLW